MARTIAGRKAPGLSQVLPFTLGPIAGLRHDPLRFLVESRARFGDVVRFQRGPLVTHLLIHPDHIHQILVDRQANYP